MLKKSINFVLNMSRTTAISIAIASGVLFFMGWLVIDSAFKYTGGPEFCGGCHTMQPLVKAFRDDVHGGNNVNGTAAECVDCHLPHDSKLHYVISKTAYGIHDVWAQTFYDLDAIDWIAKREHRESFTYDSGCMTCHKQLERASMPNPKTFVAHKPYFLGEIESKCVSCHKNVGHKNLVDHFASSNKEGTP